MIIQINENWRIATDPSNWIVEKRNGTYTNKKTGEKMIKWDGLSFHSSCEAALNRLFELHLRYIDSDVPEEIIRQGREIAREITNALRFIESFGREVLEEVHSQGGFQATSATLEVEDEETVKIG